MSFKTNRRTHRVFRMSDRLPEKDSRSLLLRLVKIVNDKNALDILLVRDGLKPASFVYIPESRVKALTNFLDSMSLVWAEGEHTMTPFGGKIVEIYLAKNTRNLKPLITGFETGKALGYPPSAIKFFEVERNEAQNRAEARFPYPKGKWFEQKSPEEKKAYNEARAKAYDEELAPFEQDPDSVFFVYKKGDKVAKAVEQRWKNHLTEKYGVKFN
jgi:hypothetical protein